MENFSRNLKNSFLFANIWSVFYNAFYFLFIDINILFYFSYDDYIKSIVVLMMVFTPLMIVGGAIGFNAGYIDNDHLEKYKTQIRNERWIFAFISILMGFFILIFVNKYTGLFFIAIPIFPKIIKYLFGSFQRWFENVKLYTIYLVSAATLMAAVWGLDQAQDDMRREGLYTLVYDDDRKEHNVNVLRILSDAIVVHEKDQSLIKIIDRKSISRVQRSGVDSIRPDLCKRLGLCTESDADAGTDTRGEPNG